MKSRKTRTGRKSGPRKSGTASLRINIRGKDNVPLSMQQLTEGLLEAARELLRHEHDCRAKSAAIYIAMVNEDGDPVRISRTNEINIHPYRAAADDHGL